MSTPLLEEDRTMSANNNGGIPQGGRPLSGGNPNAGQSGHLFGPTGGSPNSQSPTPLKK
jgi:hypothetical protein